VLPVEHILPDLHQQLTCGDAILVAPPGAGKSTCLPLSLLNMPVFTDKKIILLQPRRVAVRAIATYLAQQLNEDVGQTIGYRIRGEVKVSANTRIEIVTEGILTRMLQNQPELPEIGLVIFDEFHERSVHADFSLALCIEVQQALRDDLRILVMSATLDIEALSKLMPNAKLLESKGKSYPVDIVYQPDVSKRPLSQKISQLVSQVFPQHTGDCLVFLPGAADINKTAMQLEQAFGDNIVVYKLFADLSKSEQQRALQPSPDHKRKIVLATNIAETSLTIEGIEVVIDSGLEKRGVFQLNLGFTHLQTQKISQASATQRAGRAGRLGPGTCYRLWSNEQQQRLLAQSTPEILHSDMSSFILESLVWGADFSQLALINQPTDAQLSQGSKLLTQLGMINSERKVTKSGKDAHKLGNHPSVANMLLRSAVISDAHLSLACTLAALLESKDIFKNHFTAQVRLRIEYIRCHPSHTIWQTIRYWHKRLDCRLCEWPLDDIGVLISLAFPLWISCQTSSQRFLLANGAGIKFFDDDPLAGQKWLAIGSMFSTEFARSQSHHKDASKTSAKVALAEELTLDQIRLYHPSLISWHQVSDWDEKKELIKAEKHLKLGAIIINTEQMPKPSTEDLVTIWRSVITTKGVMKLPFDEDALQLLQRIKLARRVLPSLILPDVSDQGLTSSLDTWLLPYLSNVFSWQALSKLNFTNILTATMDWATRTKLDKLLPKRIKVPSSSLIKLDYTFEGKVNLSVRMQEVYGLEDTPRIADGQILLHVQLLSPAGRVLQTTQDLAGFWQGSYKAVQKEMKGRYQKHFWPDDPATALATTKTKKRMIVKPTVEP
jgi:ATP-dependent helicase HrpB